jgi:hypothetical protein
MVTFLADIPKAEIRNQNVDNFQQKPQDVVGILLTQMSMHQRR